MNNPISHLADALRAEIRELVREELGNLTCSDLKPEEIWITERELSARVRVPIRTLQHYRLVDRGGPPFRKFGRAIRYSIHAADLWNRTRDSTASRD